MKQNDPVTLRRRGRSDHKNAQRRGKNDKQRKSAQLRRSNTKPAKETVVETNAAFSLDDVRPIYAGALSDSVHRLIDPHAGNQTVILKAALECDRSSLYEAFGRDPLLNGRVSDAKLRALADDMIKCTIKYLPQGWE